jgi:hypothetical protein
MGLNIVHYCATVIYRTIFFHFHGNNSGSLKLKLKLVYDRRSFGQSVLVSGSHLESMTSIFFYLTIAGFFMWDTLSDERTRLQFTCTVASGPCQSSHSWVEVPQNSRPYFTVSSETSPTWRARSPYLYPPGTGWPSYTPGHWVPFCRLLQLAGMRWRYSNPPPHGEVEA